MVYNSTPDMTQGEGHEARKMASASGGRLALFLFWERWRSGAGAAARAHRGREVAARDDVARFTARADDALARGSAAKAGWGALIADATTGEILYARNADGYFAPASNAKLFTTALALATLGPDYPRAHDDRSARAARTATAGSRATWCWWGGATPTCPTGCSLCKARRAQRTGWRKILAQLADQVAARGVREVTGDVVADDSYFALQRFPSGWTVDDTVWSYGAAVSPIAVNDNVMTLEVRPGTAVGAPLRVEPGAASGVYQVRIDGTTTATGTMQQLRLSRDPDSRVFAISGTLPLDSPARPLMVAVPEPAEDAAALLVQLLRARGVHVRGHATALHAGDPEVGRRGAATVLAEHVSPPLLEDVRATNKMSLNLHAELMLRVAAKEKGGALTIMDDALMFASQFRQGIGIGTGRRAAQRRLRVVAERSGDAAGGGAVADLRGAAAVGRGFREHAAGGRRRRHA